MTEQLYLEDSSVREFEATVERRLDDRIALDRTHFYPEGGGQPADRGVLEASGDTWRVVDVQKKDAVYHRLVSAKGEEAAEASDAVDSPAVGTTVTGRLDWERRWAHMRYHTAQHLLSALLLEAFDARTTGNQVYHDRSRIDCECERFSEADLATVERRMNELIDRGMDVRWYELDREVAEAELDTDRTRIDLLPDSIERLRIVEIGPDDDPYDRTACAGTHVEATDDIGRFVLSGRETKGSGQERLTFRLE